VPVPENTDRRRTDDRKETVFDQPDNIVLVRFPPPDGSLPEALKGKIFDFAEMVLRETRKIREAVEEGIWAAADL